jgi:nucleoside-diphosphate-sugar epimerase
VSTPPRILLTGGGGFVGRHVLPLLWHRGFEVHAPSRSQLDLLRPGEALAEVARIQPTHLLHLAWNATPGRFWTAEDNLDWVAASLSLFRAFAAHGGQRAVFAGTCAEYDWSADLLDEATTPCRPATLYGIAKDALQRLVAAEPCGVEVAWGRVFFLYGPGEARGRLVPDVITALLAGQEIGCGDGMAERDFMHVEDVAGALVALLDSGVTGPVNIASGQCRPLWSVIDAIAAQIGRPDLVRFGARPTPPNEPRRLAAATRRLQDEVGFTPRRGLADGLAETIAWWRARSWRLTDAY